MLLVVCVLLDTGSTVLMKSAAASTITTENGGGTIAKNANPKVRLLTAFLGYFLS